MSSTITVQAAVRRSAPRLAQPIAEGVAWLLQKLSSWTQPHTESPAEAAARVRRLADQYLSQPSFAADLRAAADRHLQESER